MERAEEPAFEEAVIEDDKVNEGASDEMVANFAEQAGVVVEIMADQVDAKEAVDQ